jgi:hypothetical protein
LPNKISIVQDNNLEQANTGVKRPNETSLEHSPVEGEPGVLPPPSKRTKTEINDFSRQCDEIIRQAALENAEKNYERKYLVYLRTILAKFPDIQRNAEVTRKGTTKFVPGSNQEKELLRALEIGSRRTIRQPAVALYMRGKVATKPCEPCRKGEGHLKQCIIGDNEDEVCASCQYLDRYYHTSSKNEVIKRCLGRIPSGNSQSSENHTRSWYYMQ